MLNDGRARIPKSRWGRSKVAHGFNRFQPWVASGEWPEPAGRQKRWYWTGTGAASNGRERGSSRIRTSPAFSPSWAGGAPAPPSLNTYQRDVFLSLLGADVQPDHGSSGFADDRIAIAAPTTFEPSFGREIAGQETKQDPKNNQACDRKQHRIANIHGPTVVSRREVVKRVRLAGWRLCFFRTRDQELGRGRPRPRAL